MIIRPVGFFTPCLKPNSRKNTIINVTTHFEVKVFLEFMY